MDQGLGQCLGIRQPQEGQGLGEGWQERRRAGSGRGCLLLRSLVVGRPHLSHPHEGQGVLHV